MHLSQVKNLSTPLRLGLFTLTLLIIWLPFLITIHLLIGQSDPNLTTILTMGILFVIFLFLVKFWGNKVYNNPRIFSSYGLVFSRTNLVYLIQGLVIGFSANWLLFLVKFLLGWVSFQTPSTAIIPLVIEGFISAMGIALAEELLFRGWLFFEIERDSSPVVATHWSSLIFALLHFIKPPSEIIRTFVTFPALIILGYTLAIAKRSHKNLLGIPIGIHGGLVWGYYVVNVGEMVNYNDNIPQWITGIDRNPIAGIMGISFLSVLLVTQIIALNKKNKTQ